MIEVLDPGPSTTVQDLGRVGLGHLGVPRAGAADPVSLALANRLVGNGEQTAALELVVGGLVARFRTSRHIALTGAPVPATLAGRALAHNRPVLARAGDVLVTGPAPFGVYAYLAVGGGIDVAPVLGSRSTDTLSGTGPPPLAAGQLLPVAAPTGPPAYPGEALPDTLDSRSHLVVRFRFGPREALFTAAARSTLITARWEVTHQTDRVGARLSGPPLEWHADRTLGTEGLGYGSIQVPQSGQPIIHLANHPPTGGYPVIGVLTSRDAIRVSQARPGTVLHFQRDPRPLLAPLVPPSTSTEKEHHE